MDSDQLVAGDLIEVEAFGLRNGAFVESLDSLQAAMNAVFTRGWSAGDAANAVIFYLGRRCVDDFLEILLLCANGHAAGASALLRGLYERAVTAAYLKQQPELAIDFLEYDSVQRWKLARAIRKLPVEFDDQADDWNELEEQFNAVRSKFVVTSCKNCGTTRVNNSWCKLDFVSMTQRVGALGTLLVPAYYVPLSHAHSTLRSISARLQEEDGSLKVRSQPDYRDIDWTLRIAHTVLLEVLATQVEHFGLDEQRPAVDAAGDAYRHVWGTDDDVTATG